MQVKSLKKLFSSEEIAERVAAIADKLNEDYAGRETVMICVLKGAFMFFSDLLKLVTFSPEIDFIRMSSYGRGNATSGAPVITKDVELPLAGKDVILVEDIVDTGITMSFLAQRLHAQGASSLSIVALVDKSERRETSVSVDYPVFSLDSGFIVGFGLDYAERFRELPALYTVEFEK